MSITPIQPGTAYATQPASTKQTTGTEKSGQTQAVNSPVSAIVDIKSGWELMLSRLWEVDDPNYEPPYVSQFERDSYRGKVYSFLNYEDRKLVSELYEYARDNGISFNKVDDFAFYLSNYRSCPDVNPGYLGFIDYSDNPGEFRPEDEKIIQRLLTSKAIKDTTIDHGFLNLMFNSPNKTAHGGIDFEFLQEVVFSHSASGSDGAADPDAVVPLRPWQIVEMFKQSYRDQGWDENKMTLFEFQGRQAGWWPTEEEGKFGAYANRINGFMRGFLNDNDKDLLGLAYAMAEEKGEKPEKIDKLAIELALLRMQQYMEGKLQPDTPKEKTDNEDAYTPYQQLEEAVKNLNNKVHNPQT